MIEDFFGVSFGQLVRWLDEAVLFVMVLLAVFLVRQVSMMNRVVNVPIHNWFRYLAWGYLIVVIFSLVILVII